MTVAQYADYVQAIGMEDFQRYENPGLFGNLSLATNFTCTRQGLGEITFQFTATLGDKDVVGCTMAAVVGATILLPIFGPWIYPTLMGVGAATDIKNITIVTITKVRLSNEYRIWKGQQVQHQVSEVFEIFLQEDGTLNNLMCPYAKELPETPVLAPDGLTYEKSHILQRIRTKKAGANSGAYLLQDFNEKDLTFDLNHYLKVAKRIKVLVEEEIDRKDLCPNDRRIIKDGLMAYKHNRDQNNVFIFNELVEFLQGENNSLRDKELKESKGSVWDVNEKYHQIFLKKRAEIYSCFTPYKISIKDN